MNTAELQVLLEGVSLPADKQALLRYAREQQAAPDELAVLEKLPERLSYVDMAAELYVSLNTVKTHLRHIYLKLGVSSRSSAVKRATSLGLL